MRGVDTNVLVRYVTRDDPRQAQIVSDLFDRAEQDGESFFVPIPVVCELVWTLRGRPYLASRAEIAAVLEGLLDTALFDLQDRDLVQRALGDYRTGAGDFADYLIGWLSRRAQCSETLTSDRALGDCERFQLLEA
jgi:predicted nucleic-acid-binding protein